MDLALRRWVSKGDSREGLLRDVASPEQLLRARPTRRGRREGAAAWIADRREDKHGGERRFRRADGLSVGQEAPPVDGHGRVPGGFRRRAADSDGRQHADRPLLPGGPWHADGLRRGRRHSRLLRRRLRGTQPRGERDRRLLHLYRAGPGQARRRRRRLLRGARLRGHVGRARGGFRLFRFGPVRPARPQGSVDGLRGRGSRDHRDHGLSRARFLGARARLLHDRGIPDPRGFRRLGVRGKRLGLLSDGGLAAGELSALGFRRDHTFRRHLLHRHRSGGALRRGNAPARALHSDRDLHSAFRGRDILLRHGLDHDWRRRRRSRAGLREGEERRLPVRPDDAIWRRSA